MNHDEPRDCAQQAEDDAAQLTRLLGRAAEEIQSLTPRSAGDSRIKVLCLYAFFKAEKTYRAIRGLLRDRLAEDAACLLRVQFELAMFLDYVRQQPDSRTKRFFEYREVELAKYLRGASCAYRSSLGDVCSPERRKELERDEKAWDRKGRQKFSWTDQSIADMAKQSHWKEQYDVLYTLYSCLIHPSSRAVDFYLQISEDAIEIAGDSDSSDCLTVLRLATLYTGCIASRAAEALALKSEQDVTQSIAAICSRHGAASVAMPGAALPCGYSFKGRV